jgi:hypothetical protein
MDGCNINEYIVITNRNNKYYLYKPLIGLYQYKYHNRLRRKKIVSCIDMMKDLKWGLECKFTYF